MCDETVDMRPNMDIDANVVAIFFHTPDAVHAYGLADKYRKKGRIVVLAGLHASFLPDEALEHADAVLIGEIEGIWAKMLADVRDGTLKKKYQRKTPVDMAKLNPYPTNIIKPARYNGVWSVLVSRGCVHRCEFCVVPPFFRGKYRLRPVADVVAEIKAAPTDWFELHADNLTADRNYAIELFTELKKLTVNWMGEATIKLAGDAELLKLAAESGCKSLLIGIETPSKAALSDSGKGFVAPEDIRKAIDTFHAHGIHITSSMIFGFDGHTKDIFRESVEFVRQIGIDEVESVILCPFPGTPLYKRMEDEGRLLTREWSKYDCSQAVFQPKHMTPQELDEGSIWFWQQIQDRTPGRSSGTFDAPVLASPEGGPAAASAPRFSSGGWRIRWKTLIALGIIAASMILDQYWLWGVLFVVWAVLDLKNRRTYLLEDVPRSESPVLYWIIVLMWLALSGWALSTAPLIQEHLWKLRSGTSEAVWVEESVPAPLAQAAAAAPAPAAVPQPVSPAVLVAMQVVGGPDAGMRFEVPAAWKSMTGKDAETLMLRAEHPDGWGDVTGAASNMGVRYGLNKFMTVMESYLEKDLPLVRPGTGKRLEVARPEGLLPMKFVEYAGTMDGQALRVVVGYSVRGTMGFTVIGVHGVSDPGTGRIVREALESFRVLE